MAGIFTRNEIEKILNGEADVSEKVAQIMSLRGRDLENYLTKSAADADKAQAVKDALEQAKQQAPEIDVTTTDAYKAVAAERDMLRALGGDDFAGVKPKFRETVYKSLDRADGAKPVAEQLEAMKQTYEEYFVPVEEPANQQNQNTPGTGKPTPMFGASVQGTMPTGEKGKSFMDTWGFVPKRE